MCSGSVLNKLVEAPFSPPSTGSDRPAAVVPNGELRSLSLSKRRMGTVRPESRPGPLCRRPIQVGTFQGKKFPTWKRHQPQKGFQRVQGFQVGNKTGRNFPTWTAALSDEVSRGRSIEGQGQTINGERNQIRISGIIFAANQAI